MTSATKMVTRSIHIDVFEEMAKTLCWPEVLLHLDFKLRYLVRLSL